MKQYFEDFIEDLRSAHGENLKSVILYGSAATGDFVPFRSNYNLLVALEEITPEDLRNAHACVREWTKLGHPVPVYFTVEELREAGDVFPIELHFMETARKVLFGDDVLKGIEISDENLRHQTEYELRSNLLRLRRKYIAASTSSENLVELMAASIGTFANAFRAVLLLKGIEPPVRKSEIVARVSESVGISGGSFDKIVAIREHAGDRTLDIVKANELFAEYLRDIETVINNVDSIRE